MTFLDESLHPRPSGYTDEQAREWWMSRHAGIDMTCATYRRQQTDFAVDNYTPEWACGSLKPTTPPSTLSNTPDVEDDDLLKPPSCASEIGETRWIDGLNPRSSATSNRSFSKARSGICVNNMIDSMSSGPDDQNFANLVTRGSSKHAIAGCQSLPRCTYASLYPDNASTSDIKLSTRYSVTRQSRVPRAVGPRCAIQARQCQALCATKADALPRSRRTPSSGSNRPMSGSETTTMLHNVL